MHGEQHILQSRTSIKISWANLESSAFSEMMCGEVKLSYENIHVKETSGFVLLFTKQTKKCCSADVKTAALQSKNKHLLTVRFCLMNRLMSFWYCDSRGQHSGT